MTSCPLYNNSNLDSTGNKMNNPYALIQRAGKYKKRISKKKTKKVRFSKKLFFYKRM
jgi:hypothetical protein